MVRHVLVFVLVIGAGFSAAPLHSQEPAPPSTSPQASSSDGACIDLNSASSRELVELPGIGPARAQAILEARKRRPFRRIEDILRVPGIGRKTFGRMRYRLCVE